MNKKAFYFTIAHISWWKRIQRKICPHQDDRKEHLNPGPCSPTLELSNPILLASSINCFLSCHYIFFIPKEQKEKAEEEQNKKSTFRFQRVLSYFFLKCQKSDEELLRIFHVPAPCLEVGPVTRILVKVASETKPEGRSVLLFGGWASNGFPFWWSKQDWINWKKKIFFLTGKLLCCWLMGGKKMRGKAITKGVLFCHIENKDFPFKWTQLKSS